MPFNMYTFNKMWGVVKKQWRRDCKELPAFIIKRLPVRFTFDNNYFNALYQGILIGGYTKMVENMLEGIEVRLGVDYMQQKEELDALAEAEKEEKVIFGGRLGEYKYYDMDAVIASALKMCEVKLG